MFKRYSALFEQSNALIFFYWLIQKTEASPFGEDQLLLNNKRDLIVEIMGVGEKKSRLEPLVGIYCLDETCVGIGS